MEDFHSHHALDELKVVEELEGLDDALFLGCFALEFLHKLLPLDCAYLGCGWQWLNLILEGHVAPLELFLHVVVVEDVELRRLIHLDVVALALPLGDVDVAFIVLVQEGLGFAEDDVLTRRLALVDD